MNKERKGIHMSNDYFKYKAGRYETVGHRVANVVNIAKSMRERILFDDTMHIMDFCSGTVLLLEGIAPAVNEITAVDISSSMNEQLNHKRNRIHCTLEVIEMDLSKEYLNRTFNGIVSSMTMHHIEDIEAICIKFYSILNDGGFIAIADLDIEDGSFHNKDTGVFHFGFDRENIPLIKYEKSTKKVRQLDLNLIVT